MLDNVKFKFSEINEVLLFGEYYLKNRISIYHSNKEGE